MLTNDVIVDVPNLWVFKDEIKISKLSVFAYIQHKFLKIKRELVFAKGKHHKDFAWVEFIKENPNHVIIAQLPLRLFSWFPKINIRKRIRSL